MTIVHHPSIDRETTAIEHLDFAPPCEYGEHGTISTESAVWVVWYRTPLICGCVGPVRLFFCAPCWEYRSRIDGKSVIHAECGFIHADQMANILRVERI